MNISLAWKNWKSQTQSTSSASLSRVSVWDGWRGMAILLLLTGHFYNRTWIWEDRLGVDAFFVLSGMLMSTILFEKRMNLKDFYIRRFSRIFPAFSLFVVVIFSFALLMRILFEKNELYFQPSEFFSTLTFFRTYFPMDPHIWSTNVPIGHLWSLNVEEHAYVIMSLLTLFILRNTNAAYVLILIGLASISICFYYYYNETVAPTYFRIRTESAVSFIFLSAGYNLLRKQYNITVHPFLPVVTLLLAFLCYLEDPTKVGRSLWVPELSFSLAPILLAFTLNHITEAHKLLIALLELKIIRLMGTWSFSIYLWQQPFYMYKTTIGSGFIALPLAIFMGILSFYFFENPIRTWINSRWTKNTSQ